MDKSSANTQAVNSTLTETGRNLYGGTSMHNTTDTAYGSAISGIYLSGPESINIDALNYYIITVDRYSGYVDFNSMKLNHVGGVIIEAGYLYNASHMEQYYRNPSLDAQCKLASQCDIPFGLYCDAKARSVEEAKKEIYQLSFCIRKYPPVLGMWVHFQLVKSIYENDQIVDYYKDELVRLGLKDRIGILATESELKTISWSSKHYENWSLWLNKHVTDISNVQKLLTPEMFSAGEDKG